MEEVPGGSAAFAHIRYVMLMVLIGMEPTITSNGIDNFTIVCSVTRGPFLERPGKLSGPVSHPVSPRKLYGCFSKLPLFSIPLIFPVTCPVIYGWSWPPVKLPGSHNCYKTKQNGGRGRTFLFRAKTTVISKTPFSSLYGRLWSNWTLSALTSKNRVARWGAKGGVGEKHGEKLPAVSGNPGK